MPHLLGILGKAGVPHKWIFQVTQACPFQHQYLKLFGMEIFLKTKKTVRIFQLLNTASINIILTKNYCVIQHSSPSTKCPRVLVKVAGFLEFFFWSLAFGVSAVNLCCCQCELTLAASHPTSNLLLLGKQVGSELCLKHTGFETISKSILVTQSFLCIPGIVMVCSYKFQTKFWINEFVLYLHAPYCFHI